MQATTMPARASVLCFRSTTLIVLSLPRKALLNKKLILHSDEVWTAQLAMIIVTKEVIDIIFS